MHPTTTNSNPMAPAMTRTNSNARAERCWRLRVRGRTWQEVADDQGFRSRRAAQKAVEQFLKRTPPPDVVTLRRAMGDGLTMVREQLLDSMDAAQAKGDHRGVAMIATVVVEAFDKQAKLMGLHIAVPAEVNVNVQSMTQILTDTRARLMAAVDAEVVDDVVDAELVAIEP